MTEDETVQIGDEMPLIGTVEVQDLYRVAISWIGGRRRGRTDIVDLAPMILTFKLYRPLRDNLALFKTAHVAHDGCALAWATSDEIDMAATTLERLAEETMTPADFKAFLERNGLTLDAAAAQLGISRRLVAYYASGQDIPRYIALACAYLDRRAA